MLNEKFCEIDFADRKLMTRHFSLTCMNQGGDDYSRIMKSNFTADDRQRLASLYAGMRASGLKPGFIDSVGEIRWCNVTPDVADTASRLVDIKSNYAKYCLKLTNLLLIENITSAQYDEFSTKKYFDWLSSSNSDHYFLDLDDINPVGVGGLIYTACESLQSR